LRKQDEKTGEGIEGLIFTFDNIFMKISDDKAIQRALRNIDRKDLVLALRKASQETKDRIYKNMSQSAADMLKEDIDVMGPQKVHLVEEAQRKVVSVIKMLAKEGVISFASNKDEEEVV
jgi:flagellar motor switch protein FliG